MSTHGRARGIVALAVLGALLALAGCGGAKPSGNGVAAKSPAAILQAAKAAAAQAQSVHVVGTIDAAGKPISLDMELLAGKGGKGKISEDGFTLQLVQTAGAVYINGSAAFYRHVAGSTAAQLLQGRWLKAPADSGELASLASLTDLARLVNTALAGHGSLSKGATSEIEGQPAIALEDASKGGTLYVATSGRPYPLEIAKSGSETGKVILDRWDQPVQLAAPAGAIEVSKLQGAG
jgi:hypothetical protein